MKKLVLFTMLLITSRLSAQTAIPNGNFETWNVTQYYSFNGWLNSNNQCLQDLGIVNLTKVSDTSGGTAIKLQTYISKGDTEFAYILNGTPPNQKGSNNFGGGVPYSSRPTSITGYYKYDLKGKDTAMLLVYFKKNGKYISQDLFKIRGTGTQYGWKAFSFKLSLNSTPDSMIIAAASSNALRDIGVANGSTLYLDQLAFAGDGTMPAIPNGNFSNWTDTSYDLPADWVSFGGGTSIVTRTTDKYRGEYALQMENGPGFGEVAQVTSGKSNNSIGRGPSGGRPYTGTKDTLIGYYKYNNNGNGDTARIQVSITKNGNYVGGNGINLMPAETYTYFEIPFNAGQAPDTLRVDIQSSGWNYSHPGSTLIIDEIQLKSQPLLTGIRNEMTANNALKVYPNPASNIVIFDFTNPLNNNATLIIYNGIGEIVYTENFNGLAHTSVNIAAYQAGVYYYKFTNSQTDIRGKFLKN